MKEVGMVNIKQISIKVESGGRSEKKLSNTYFSGSILGGVWNGKGRVKHGNTLYYTWVRVGARPKH